ncbi:MAG: Uma2 family endonuclease [Trueperaceae bacterium]
MSLVQDKLVSPQEYLELERKAPFKSEYRHSLIIPIPGASVEHIIIRDNITRHLGNQLENQGCRAFSSDLKVQTGQSYSYPDITVVCGTLRFEDIERDVLLNPTLIIEILSPSTEIYDRSEKFNEYRQLASFSEYILVSQNQPLIEQYIKQGDGSWKFIPVGGLDATVNLETINCTLTLKDVYSGLTF